MADLSTVEGIRAEKERFGAALAERQALVASIQARQNNGTGPTPGGLTGVAGIISGIFSPGKKPDGTPQQPAPSNSSVNEGSAERVTNQKEESATNEIQNGKPTDTKNKSVNVAGGSALINLVPNPLHQFASYSPLWTMACLTKEQFNNPKLYRDNDSALTQVVFSSGGRYDGQRANTASGVPEYFVNNFSMQSVIAASPKTGNSNAVKFSFEIIEPYSMGLLLQSMQVAAISNQYANYLDNAPYLLKLDFKGYDEKMGVLKVVKSKYFVMKLTSIKFEVTEAGSKYRVEGVPYNHQGFSDSYNIAYTDLKLKGDTVEEACANLTRILNENEQKLVSEKRIGQPDTYIIDFPTSPEKSQIWQTQKVDDSKSATVNPNQTPKKVVSKPKPAAPDPANLDPNDIGASVFGFGAAAGGNFGFGFERDKIDPKTGKVNRDKLTIDPKNREFQFAQRQSLTDIVTQLILSSKYAKDAINPDKLTKEGFIRWFKLDVQMQFGEFDTLLGDFSKIIIYRVVPYLVHHTIFSNPNAAPYGYKALEKLIAKEYNYIYTGKNVDILNFNIQINNLFFTGNSPLPEAASAQVTDPNQQGPAPEPGKTVSTAQGSNPQVQLANTGRRRLMRDPSTLTKENHGGSGTKTTEQKVAESFHKAFITGGSADLVTVDLEILGDTYWLVDSGIANHFAIPSSATPQITNDGSANYEGSDVFIFIRFQNPQDVDVVTGQYKWPNSGKVSPFTGIYKVTLVESTFNDGMFKQKLKCIRMPLQEKDLEGIQPVDADKSQALATDVKETKPQPSGLNTPPKPEVSTEPPPPPPVLAELAAAGGGQRSALDDFIKRADSLIKAAGTAGLANTQTGLALPTVQVPTVKTAQEEYLATRSVIRF
jgi:hypothetical protein